MDALPSVSWVRRLSVRTILMSVDYFASFAKIRRSTEAFSAFMEREIAVRTEEVRAGSEYAEERVDAFTMLVRANEQETGKLRLSDQEVVRTENLYCKTYLETYGQIGNVFILLFAGHGESALFKHISILTCLSMGRDNCTHAFRNSGSSCAS